MELPKSLTLAACAFVVYCVLTAIYRLYFSPIAKFPGPRLAALSLWYEFYYDVVKRGRYTWEIEKMHKRYGPIVRINPFELHIADPDYYDELYVGSSRRTSKYGWATKAFGESTSVLATESHELHRIRRAAVAPFFSKQAVQRLEPTVQSVVDKLLLRLQALQGTGECVNMVDVFTALTGDIISEYSFDRSYRLIDNPEFAPHWHKVMMDISEAGHMFKQFGWMQPMLKRFPRWITKILSPQAMSLLGMQDLMLDQVLEVKQELAGDHKNIGQKTIFYDMLTNDQVRQEEKETEHLVTEAQVVVAAGIVTTAHTLSTIAFYVLNNPEVLKRLQQELAAVMGDTNSKPSWQVLEGLLYLSAVISEGLRIGYGVSTRLQRISPDVALQYKNWSIPTGTPVSMSATFVHDNPSIFPDPRTFNPDRWLQASDVRLSKYLVSFCKGSRQCLGMNLAYCEMFLTFAAMFAPGRFRFELFETTKHDVEIAHDFFNPCFPLDSKGIRVLVN